MLHHARKRHAEVRGEREKARDALKGLIHQMLAELGELGAKTGNFHESVGRYAEVIEGPTRSRGWPAWSARWSRRAAPCRRWCSRPRRACRKNTARRPG